MNYVAILTTRNRHENLARTLDSLKKQSLVPSHILVFDDGSMPPVQCDSDIAVLRREDEGYDIQRIVKNWNLSIAHALKNDWFQSADALLISADDCIYPSTYIEQLLKRMQSGHVVVASGSRGLHGGPDGWKPPEGSGRVINRAFLERINFWIPEKAGYEPWIVYEAMRLGFEVACYSDLRYEHLEKFGSSHGFVEWGHMAHTLGYDPVFFLGRCVKNLLTDDIPTKSVLKILYAYLKDFFHYPKDAFYERFSEEFRQFVKTFQRTRIKTTLRTLQKP